MINISPNAGSAGHHKSLRPALISRYRSDDEIRGTLDEICARPAPVDEPARRHALTILDDLAEEMIGRHHFDDPTLKIRIRNQRERWTGRVPPVTDPSSP